MRAGARSHALQVAQIRDSTEQTLVREEVLEPLARDGPVQDLARLPEMAPKVARAIDSLVERQLAEGRAGTGPRFWSRPNDALRGA